MKNIFASSLVNPLLCPKCKIIRKAPDEATPLMGFYEKLMWKSFGMCSKCNNFKTRFPEQALENETEYNLKLQEQEELENKIKESKKYRIYAQESKFSRITSIYTEPIIQFSTFSFPYKELENIVKSIELVNEELAQSIVEQMKTKGTNAWYEKEETKV